MGELPGYVNEFRDCRRYGGGVFSLRMDLTKEKILVTGGNGFLGTHVVRKLVLRGVPREHISTPRQEECDLRIRENCERVVAGQSVVLHIAGVTGGIEFHRAHPAQMFYDNLVMGVELMDAARQAGVQKFVTIGSATEYPEKIPLPFKEELLWFGYPEALHAPYTVAKKMLEVQAQAYRKQYGFNAVHLVMTNMYGPGFPLESDFAIPMLVKRIWRAKSEGQNTVEMWGTGAPTRDFLYVEDAAEGILLAAEKYDKPEPVNLGSGWEISIRELTELVMRLMNFTGEIRSDPSKPEGHSRRVLDTSRAEREFGFRARTDFETGLKATIEWYEGLLAKNEK